MVLSNVLPSCTSPQLLQYNHMDDLSSYAHATIDQTNLFPIFDYRILVTQRKLYTACVSVTCMNLIHESLSAKKEAKSVVHK